jgi:hypothetical protein
MGVSELGVGFYYGQAPTASSAPAGPVTGEFYYDTVLGYIRTWNGSQWLPSGGFPPYANGYISGSTIANASSYNYTIGTIVLPAPGLVRVFICMNVTIGPNDFQAISLTCLLNGSSLTTGGYNAAQIPSSNNQPYYAMSAAGTSHLSAGSYTIQADVGVGGGGTSVTTGNIYGEAQQVGP